MKLRMKPGPRAPQVGDVYTKGAEHMRVCAVTSDGGVFVDSTSHPDTDGSHVGAGSLAGWRLVVRGARTLAQREDGGELPDVGEDSRTPLEKMTAERDELRERVAELEEIAEVSRAEFSDDGFAIRKLKLRLQNESDLSYAAAQMLGERLDFARAFAASQGRVIAGLKIVCEMQRVRVSNSVREFGKVFDVLVMAEAALADIGDAEREPGDDVAWCEQRAAKALPRVRDVLGRHATWKREAAE